jgi:outer membrane protein TolC
MTKICFVLILLTVSQAHALNLKQAEHLALQNANELGQKQAEYESLHALSIKSRQWQDPVIQFGALNLPTDTFRLNQEPMTQLQLSLMQQIPKGQSLKFKHQKLHALANAKQFDKSVQKIAILQQIRQLWVTLYYWQHVKTLLKLQVKTFLHLEQVVELMVANNKAAQSDLLNAQLQVELLNEKIINARQQAKTTKALLKRWLIHTKLSSLVIAALPKWTPGKTTFENHPTLAIDTAKIKAAQSSIGLAKQDFLPGLNVGVAYGYRQGRNTDYSNRPDFATALVKISLPLFPKKRQQMQLTSAQKTYIAQREQRDIDYKNLKTSWQKTQITVKQTNRKIRLYQHKLLPTAKSYTESSLIAYQNNKTDFLTVAQSNITYLQTQIGYLRERVNLSNAHISLLFLQGK